MAECRNCGSDITRRPGARGGLPAYCGAALCISAKRNAKTDPAVKARNAERARKKYAETRAEGAPSRLSSKACPCAVCGKLLHYNSKTSLPSGQRTCQECRSVDKYAQRYCASCQVEFRARIDRDQRFCSRPCVYAGLRKWPGTADRAERLRQKCRRRRALKLGRPSEPYSTVGIAERDGFRCGLCTGPVDMGLSGRDPMGPTIDHVLPIALGGDDTRANVQLAHLSCNMHKGARELSRV